MAKNEFLPFGTAEGANVLAAPEYENLAARHNGFTSGVAKSKELNKVWRQASVMASALAQFIVDTDKKDLLDDGNAPAVKNRLVSAMKEAFKGEMPAVPKTVQTTGDSTTDVMSQKSVTEALGKKAPSNVADGKLTKDQNGADIPDKPKFIENLGLGEAAKSGLKQGTGTSKTDVISQDGVTKALNGKLDKTGGTITATAKALEIKTRADASGYIQVSDENGNAIHQLGKTTAGNKLILRNVTEDATLTVGAKGVEFNG
ncbi:MAG TPA: hypothetical protein DIT05_19985, partial [Morganella sp. (in: Bacteria)]|nr:hypothetical protein [Morganella sp. (in: enterobacteria)]